MFCHVNALVCIRAIHTAYIKATHIRSVHIAMSSFVLIVNEHFDSHYIFNSVLCTHLNWRWQKFLLKHVLKKCPVVSENNLVTLVSTYLMSRRFFMIAQTRQFPMMFVTTSIECIVAMAMPDDWNMTECCWYYTVARPSRVNKVKRKIEFLTAWLITGLMREVLEVERIYHTFILYHQIIC